ncbi:response regulator [Ruminococcus sp.]
MLRIAIVDDETAEIQKLQELVEQFFREKQVAYQITSYISGETFLVAQQQCDLIFLDVQMTGIDGIATARNIRQNDRKAALIYVSNFSEKMADSFAVHPFAFLEKPVMREKLWMHLQD